MIMVLGQLPTGDNSPPPPPPPPDKNECTTFAPATIVPMVNANVKHNSNPNSSPNLNPDPTLN